MTDMTTSPVNEQKGETAFVKPRGFSPALLLLLFPAVGVIAAVVLIAFSGGGGGNGNGGGNAGLVAPTPPETTQVLLPTPMALADTPILDFELPLLNGGTARLTDYSGQIVFLNFWQTWCEPCKRELPAFAQYLREQETRLAGNPDAPRVQILTVNVEESADDVRAFLVQQGVTGVPVLLDQQAEIANQYGVFNIPVTFVIDQTGLIRYPIYGEVRLDDLAMYVDALAAESA